MQFKLNLLVNTDILEFSLLLQMNFLANTSIFINFTNDGRGNYTVSTNIHRNQNQSTSIKILHLWYVNYTLLLQHSGYDEIEDQQIV